MRVLLGEGRVDADRCPSLSTSQLLALHREMVLLRRLDERLTALTRQGRVGSHASAAGQEAVPVAAALAARKTDWVFPAFREGGTMLLRGFPLARYLAQVFGTRDDVLKGRQMPGHQSSREVRQVSWSSAVGTQLAHAVGAAWAARYRHDDMVTLAFFGDGAASSPDFHSALNFAAVLGVPCVFVCQNNQYAVSTPFHRQTAAASVAIKGQAYAVPAVRVDGNDVLAVYHVLESALGRARAGGGPQLVEAVTYRMGPHSTSDDPTRYRPQAEADAWAEQCPVRRLEAHLRRRELVDDTVLVALEADVAATINLAIEQAERQPRPEATTLFDDVYERLPWHLGEQRSELLRAVTERS